MKRRKGLPDFNHSESEILISYLDRHEDWAVIVCLVGGGQEIHTGEAGIALQGTEIKSLRAGHANLRDGYARVEKGEVWLRNVHIAPWANAAHDNHDPLRPRKLLLHREQIGQLAGAVSQKGYTLVPLRMYIRKGRAKIERGLARGKKRYDKRQAIKEREHIREMDAAIRRRIGRG